MWYTIFRVLHKIPLGVINMTDIKSRNAEGKKAGVVGIICNVFLFALKLLLGIFSGSVSVVADAVNNLSDASSGIISLLGFKLSERPADKEHPYGHGRYEYLAALIMSLIIIIVGFELLQQSIAKILHPEAVSFTVLFIAALAASVIVKLWMMVYYKRVGRKINSKTLIAASADSRNDVLSTTAVLIGAVITKIWNVQLDGYIGAAVAVFVIISGFGMAKEMLDPVLGRAPDRETVGRIREKILSYDGVLGAHDLMVHDYGVGRQFASVHVEMAAEGDVIEKHEIIDEIERDFLENDGIHMVVHFDPVPSENSELGDLRAWIAGEVRKLDSRITIHDLRISGGEEKLIALDCAVPSDMEIGDAEIKIFITNIIRIKYPQSQCAVRIDRSFTEIAD